MSGWTRGSGGGGGILGWRSRGRRFEASLDSFGFLEIELAFLPGLGRKFFTFFQQHL
jgi:hypothetical protein